MRVYSRSMRLAMRDLARTSRRTNTRALNDTGRLWTSFCSNNTKTEDPGEIEAYLRRPVTRRGRTPHVTPLIRKRGKSKLANEWQGTIAAAIVAKRARAKGRTFNTPADFYRNVAKFARTHKNSARYLKSAWIPALRVFGAKGPKRRGIGRYKSPLAGDAAKAKRSQKVPHGFLENHARGITKVHPDIVQSQVGPVVRQLRRWIRQNLREGKRKAGFR